MTKATQTDLTKATEQAVAVPAHIAAAAERVLKTETRPDDVTLPRLACKGSGSSGVVVKMGDQKVDMLGGVDALLLEHHSIRVFFGKEFDPNSRTPPVCFSNNGETPDLSSAEVQAPTCAECPHSKFGRTADGKPIAQECKQKKLLLLIREGKRLPMLFTLPPSALKSWKAAYTAAAESGVPLQLAVTNYNIEDEDGSKRLVTRMVRPLTEREIAFRESEREKWADVAKRQSVGTPPPAEEGFEE